MVKFKHIRSNTKNKVNRNVIYSNVVAHYLSKWLPKCLKIDLMTVLGVVKKML